MSEIVQKRTFTVRRKYVYWLVQLMFVVALVGFLYSYMTNVDPFNGLTNVTTGASGEPSFVKFIYGKFGGGEFAKPMAVTVAGERVYVSDTNNRRVQIFNYNGDPIKTFGTRGSKPGQFEFPYGLATDNAGNVYVADLYNGAVSKFDKDGKFLSYFAEKQPSDKVLQSPAGLAIRDNKVYVTEINENDVKVFDLNGKQLMKIGKAGKAPGQFFAPNAVTLDKDGRIYVTDTGNQRIQIFDQNGKFVKVLNGSPDGNGQSVFVNPRGVGVDDQGHLYVVSNLTHRFYVFDKDGKQIYSIGGYGDAEKEFDLPNGLFVDDRGRVYITDTSNQRVAVFQS